MYSFPFNFFRNDHFRCKNILYGDKFLNSSPLAQTTPNPIPRRIRPPLTPPTQEGNCGQLISPPE